MKNQHIVICLLATAASLACQAQELSGSLRATGVYKAEIRQHSRKSGLPARLEIEIPEETLPIAGNAVPVSSDPAIETLTSVADAQLPERFRGYAALLCGSYLNTSLSAGYRLIDSESTTFGVWLQHSSSSLYRPKTVIETDVEPNRRKIFDETLSLYGSHIFENAGKLSASATYHLGYFNYISNTVTLSGVPSPSPSQTLNDFMLDGRWQGIRPADRGLFTDLSLRYRYFGYREFYQPLLSGLPSLKPARENDVDLGVKAGYSLADAGTVGIGADLRLLMYSNPHPDEILQVYLPYFENFQALKNTGLITLTPGYSLVKGNWSLRAGARLDLGWGFMPKNQFSTFHIAPDIAVSYMAHKFAAYISADGGVVPNTLASRSELDMYQSPALINTIPQYTPLHLTLGIKSGYIGGFRAGAHFSYAIADNTPVSGWYSYWLHDIPLGQDDGAKVLSTLSLKGFSAGIDMEYGLSNLLKVEGALAYQRQSGATGYFNGIDRPRWTADINAEVTPLRGLAVGAGYHYRGVRRLTLAERVISYNPNVGSAPSHNFTDSKPEYISYRLSDLYDLGVYARYTLDNRYTFSLAADNILGCNPTLNPLIPCEGIVITGGVAVLF